MTLFKIQGSNDLLNSSRRAPASSFHCLSLSSCVAERLCIGVVGVASIALALLASLALHWRRWHCIGVADVAGIAGNVICIFLCGYLELVA
jgi:hypothetical protein